MAFRAAMTGHQVYSTLHTNSALGALTRLLDIGILPDVLAGNMIGVMGQRLVRRLCPHCKQAYRPQPFERRLLGIDQRSDVELHRAVGCRACEYQGYRGRFALVELLRFDAELDDLIAHRATQKQLTDAAYDKGFTPLADDGARQALAGETSLDEVARVIDLTSRV
jgi:type II secretory ATPase GspE/PulE/Tfp pilus assembly ATPase PilB-like protein